MKIYPQEEHIRDKIEAGVKSSIVLDAKPASEEQEKLFAKSIDRIVDAKTSPLQKKVNAFINEPNPELLYGSAILVSTNMNYNHDTFLPEEVWKARNTPINTPFNKSHNQEDIIGHIIGSRVLDQDFMPIDSDVAPDFFHVEVPFVIYEFLYPDYAANIRRAIETGSHGVSMECVIPDFDYAVATSDGAMQIIERNEETSFLTQYLKPYGGSGEFTGYRVGRLLRNITFIGMANVENPANKYSFFTNIVEKDSTYLYSLIESHNLVASQNKPKEGEDNMSDELQAKLDDTKGDLDVSQADLKVSQERVQELERQVASLNEENDKNQAELNDIRQNEIARDRLNQLKEAGLTFDNESDEIDRLMQLDDSQFAIVLHYAQMQKDTSEYYMESENTKNDVDAVSASNQHPVDETDVAKSFGEYMTNFRKRSK